MSTLLVVCSTFCTDFCLLKLPSSAHQCWLGDEVTPACTFYLNNSWICSVRCWRPSPLTWNLWRKWKQLWNWTNIFSCPTGETCWFALLTTSNGSLCYERHPVFRKKRKSKVQKQVFSTSWCNVMLITDSD